MLANLHATNEKRNNFDQVTARMLMERGANIGMRNLFEETPISLILPETMEQFLDEHCLTSKGEVSNGQ